MPIRLEVIPKCTLDSGKRDRVRPHGCIVADASLCNSHLSCTNSARRPFPVNLAVRWTIRSWRPLSGPHVG
jgi:hypothetical protein